MNYMKKGLSALLVVSAMSCTGVTEEYTDLIKAAFDLKGAVNALDGGSAVQAKLDATPVLGIRTEGKTKVAYSLADGTDKYDDLTDDAAKVSMLDLVAKLAADLGSSKEIKFVAYGTDLSGADKSEAVDTKIKDATAISGDNKTAIDNLVAVLRAVDPAKKTAFETALGKFDETTKKPKKA